MTTQWEGHYLDGRTAARQRVTIRLMRSGLEIITEKGTTAWWPYPGIRQTQGSYAGEEVRLERGAEIPEVLLVSDAAFLTALHLRNARFTARYLTLEGSVDLTAIQQQAQVASPTGEGLASFLDLDSGFDFG